MLLRIKENNPIVLAWPSGEWQESLLRAVVATTLTLEQPSNPRALFFALPSINCFATIVRPSDVPVVVRQGDAAAGFTGSDVLAEAGELNFSAQEKPRREIPLAVLDKNAPKPKLYLGLTPNAQTKKMELETAVRTGPVYTSYPKITQRIIEKLYGVSLPLFSDPNELERFWQRMYRDNADQPWLTREWEEQGKPLRGIITRPGKVEIAWASDEANYAISDITSTGETAEANGIAPVLTFFNVTLQLISKTTEELSPEAQKSVALLFEALEEGAQKQKNRVGAKT